MRKIDDISSLDVCEILPHRKPFLLIDKLLCYDEETTAVKTSFTVREGGVFVSDGCLQAPGLMENIAQSCAARIGFYDWLHELSVKPGVIGSVKNLVIHTLPEVGQEIITSVKPQAEAMGILLAAATITDKDGRIIAEGTIKVAV